MSTRILHISDTHLGYRQYDSNIRKQDFATAFDEVIEYAIKEDVDAVIHTGDLFHSPNPNTYSIRKSSSTMKKLDSHDIPFLSIVGNHERKFKDQWMDVFSGLVNNVYRLDQSKAFVINDEVAVYGVDSLKEQEWSNLQIELPEPKDNCMYTILCMHELLQPLVPSYQSDKTLQMVFDSLSFEPNILALGDYHGPEGTKYNDTKVFYAGATERTSVKQGEPTIRLIETKENSIDEELIYINSISDKSPRPFYSIDYTVTDNSSISDIEESVQEITDNYREVDLSRSVVVVTLKGQKKSSITVKDVFGVLDQLNVLVPHVIDNRLTSQVETEANDLEDIEKLDMDSLIDNELTEREINDTVRNVDNIVRDITTPKSEIRNEVKNIVGDNK